MTNNKGIWMLVMLSAVILLSGCLGDNFDGEIVGDSIIFKDGSNKVTVTPHTSTGLAYHCQEIKLEYDENAVIDVGADFSESISDVRYYEKIYGQEEREISGLVNKTFKQRNNKTEKMEDTTKEVWDVIDTTMVDYEEYVELSQKKEKREGKDYFWNEKLQIKKNELKELKICYSTEPMSEGKWNIWVKENGKSLDDGEYLFGDPWWNSAWEYKQNVTFANDESINLSNTTLWVNTSYFDNHTRSDFADIRVLDQSETVEYAYELFGDNGTAKVRWVESEPIGPYENRTYFIYYGNAGAVAPSYSTCGAAGVRGCTPLWNYSQLRLWRTYINASETTGMGSTIDFGDSNTISSTTLNPRRGYFDQGVWIDNGGAINSSTTVHSDALNLSTPVGNFSIEAWVNLTSGGAQKTIIEKEQAYWFIYGHGACPTSRLGLIVYGTPTGIYCASSMTVTSDGSVWQHFAATFDGAKVDFYKNGVLAQSVTNTTPSLLNEPGNVLTVGYSPAAGYGEWDGVIDELKIWGLNKTVFPQKQLNETYGPEVSLTGIQTLNNTIEPDPAYANSPNLNCSASYVHENGDNSNLTFAWYNETGILQEAYNYTVTDVLNGTVTNSNGTNFAGTLFKGHTWTCRVDAFTAMGSQTTNDTINISNSLPDIALPLTPANNSLLIGSPQTLTCSDVSGTDPDNDVVLYEFWGNQSDLGESLLQNGSNLSFDWEGLVVGQTYNWSCRSHDGNDTNPLDSFYQFSLLNITSCTDVNPELNFTIKDEVNDTAIVGTFEASFFLSTDAGETGNATFDLSGNSNYAICLDGGNVTIDEGMIEYDATNFDPRNYYFYDATIIENVTSNINLHLLWFEFATAIKLQVLDVSGLEIDDAYIHVERYEVGTGGSKLIAMGHTNEDGEDTIFLRGGTFDTGDVWYIFKVFQDGELIFTSERQKITETTVTLRVGAETFDETRNVVDDVTGFIYLNETSMIFTGTYSSISGLPRQVCFRVGERRGTRDSDLTVECRNDSASGTFTFGVNNIDLKYYSSLWTNSGNRTETIDTLFWEDITNNFGVTGGLVGVAIIVSSAAIGLGIGVVAGLIFTLTALAVISPLSFGLFSISQTAVVGLIIGGILILIRIKRRYR